MTGMARAALLAGLAACTVGCSPYGGGAFSCTSDEQCGAGGKCEPDHFCAFTNSACPSGYKYGEVSGPNSNQCVGGNGDGGVGDGPMIDGPPGQACYGTGIVQACFATAPSMPRTFSSNTTIDTDSTSMCDAILNSTAWCVISGSTVQVSAGVTVKARGSRPLVIVATDTIRIDGVLDASSRRGDMPAAGADMPGCSAGNAATATAGGAGGSFGGRGGQGGLTGGGTSGATLTVTALRGGCSGQSGAGGNPGAGGHGGGAVYLIAKTSITVTSAINASGEGADAAAPNSSSGGGGGGSGGFVGLESPSVTISGVVLANGGGGGEASGAQSTGNPGHDPDPMNPTMPAPGGTLGSTFGTDGGSGSAGAAVNGNAGSSSCGGCGTPASGGGGGGGAGIIRLVPNNPPGGGGLLTPPQS